MVLAVSFLFTGCMTAEKSKIFRETPAALVSVVSNGDINWKGEEATNLSLVSRSIRRSMEEDPDLGVITAADTLIGDIETLIMAALNSSPQIMMAPRTTVTGSRSYNQAAVNVHQEKTGMAKPADFRFINYRDKKFMSGFAAETGVNKFIFVTLDLTKTMSSGFGKLGNCRATIAMSVMIRNDRGKTLFNKKYEIPSRDQTKVSNGMYSQHELRQMIMSAIGDACSQFLDDITY